GYGLARALKKLKSHLLRERHQDRWPGEETILRFGKNRSHLAGTEVGQSELGNTVAHALDAQELIGPGLIEALERFQGGGVQDAPEHYAKDPFLLPLLHRPGQGFCLPLPLKHQTLAFAVYLEIEIRRLIAHFDQALGV